MAVAGQKNVGGFEVAVHDARLVGRLEPGRQALRQLQPLSQSQGPAFEAFLQGFAFEQLEHQVGLPVDLPEVVNGAQIGVVEGASGARLAAEAFERASLFGRPLRQEFDGHLATEPGIGRQVDDPHAAAAELSDDFVVGDLLAEHHSFSSNLRISSKRAFSSAVTSGYLRPRRWSDSTRILATWKRR